MQYKFKFNLHSTKKNFNIIKWAQKIMNIYHKPIHHDPTQKVLKSYLNLIVRWTQKLN